MQRLSQQGPREGFRRASQAARGLNAQKASAGLNTFLDKRYQWYKDANVRFDTWFNNRWDTFYSEAVQFRARTEKQLRGEWRKAQRRRGPAVDTTSMVLMGTGVGCAYSGMTLAGPMIALWGMSRALYRFVVHKVEDNDFVGLFRYVPMLPVATRQQIYGRLQRELEVLRRIQAGDMSFSDWSRWEGGNQAKDPTLDYTPERLFDDVMVSIAAHPRVQEVLGTSIHAVEEPDKVVYRIVEGVAEVYLGWKVGGSCGVAEIQVKGVASLVDFIYVFPNTADKYGFRPTGFVIRPSGNWSMDEKDFGPEMKRPFGTHEGKVYRNREGIFDWDWSVRDFQHGRERGPPGRR